MANDIKPYLQTVFDPDASALDNALARVVYLEGLLGQSDIEQALIKANASIVDEVSKLHEKMRRQEGKYRAQCDITEQKQATNNRLIAKAQQDESIIHRQKIELQNLGALLVKTQ